MEKAMSKIKKIYTPGLTDILSAIIIILLAAAFALPVAAAGISLSESVQISFPDSITFNVNAQSTTNITRLQLHYIVNRQNFAKVVSEGWPQFTPSTSVKAQWIWDMRKSSLPPAAQVQYWWTALDADGNTGQTSIATLTFNDDRYQWQTTTAGPIILEWYNGSTQFANSLMTAAQQGLLRIENDTGASPVGQVHVFIYGSQQDLLNSLLFPQQWEGGVTFEGFNSIAVAVSPDQLDFGMRAVPHELTHWIVGQLTFNDYGAGLPTWLDEGLATYGEGQLNPQYQAALQQAISSNQLISVRSLSSPFSSVPAEAYISYGESNSIVTFLIQQYGKDKMVQLLNVFHQGSTYDDALKQVYGFDQDGLDKIWRQSLGLKTTYLKEPGCFTASLA
jgi:Peptidase MA superfamily